MPKQILTCEDSPAIFATLQRIYEDGDPIRTMVLLNDLTDLGLKHGLMDETQRFQIGQLHQLLGELALKREDPGF